jgi:hypothetical protein
MATGANHINPIGVVFTKVLDCIAIIALIGDNLSYKSILL